MVGRAELFSEDDFLALLVGGHVEEDRDDGDSRVLQRLSRQISGQYVDVLAVFAGQALAGPVPASATAQVAAALEALLRLAMASSDPELVAVLQKLEVLLPVARDAGRRQRTQLVSALRDWVLAFADLLEPSDAERMRELVTFDRRALPLLDELGELRGIGPRRLERLYFAGLFTVEALTAADPSEVAQVTGLPRALADDVVQAARRYAVAQRREAAQRLAERAVEVKQVLRALGARGQADLELVSTVRTALDELRQALSAFETHSTEEER